MVYYVHVGEYQVNVLRKLRAINVDYLQVGWYQSTYLGSHISREFIDSHVRYQQAIEESVVIIYGEWLFPLVFAVYIILYVRHHSPLCVHTYVFFSHI